MPIYGYSAERPGAFFTHIVSCNESIMNEMEEYSHRYDGGHDLSTGSFVHLTVKDRDDFVDKFNIVLVDDKNELKMLKKIITGT